MSTEERSMTSIVIIDDHPVVVQGINAILSKQGYNVLGTFTNSEEGFSSLLNLHPDIVIMDLCMPEYDGFEIIKLLNALNHRIKIVIFSTSSDYADIARCARLGISGYVIKSQLTAELLHAIQLVIAGHRYFPALVLPDVPHAIDIAATSQMELSEKEKIILKALAMGKQNKEIAEELQLSPKTISTHKMRICKKLGSLNISEAVELARAKKIIG